MSIDVAALILSAGLSSRMGDFKPLLPLGGVPALERCVSLFRSAGIEDVRVVTGHRSRELEPLLKRLAVRTIVNSRYHEGMFSSVVAGVENIAGGLDAFFILPVDIPLVRPATVRQLREEFERSAADVLYPRFEGRRGHPPLIAAGHAAEIVNWNGGDGLRGALRQWENGARELEVADRHIHNDMDTPEAYGSLRENAERYQIPTEAECAALLKRFWPSGSPVIGHGRAVAELATLLAEKLNRAGYRFDLELLASAGLLHDLLRAESDHAAAGARLLREMGFGAVADLVAVHMDLTPPAEERITPAELLYLADKLVQGERRVTLEERFRTAGERHGNDPEVHTMITSRLNVALIIQTRVEAALKRSMAEVTGTP